MNKQKDIISVINVYKKRIDTLEQLLLEIHAMIVTAKTFTLDKDAKNTYADLVKEIGEIRKSRK